MRVYIYIYKFRYMCVCVQNCVCLCLFHPFRLRRSKGKPKPLSGGRNFDAYAHGLTPSGKERTTSSHSSVVSSQRMRFLKYGSILLGAWLVTSGSKVGQFNSTAADLPSVLNRTCDEDLCKAWLGLTATVKVLYITYKAPLSKQSNLRLAQSTQGTVQGSTDAGRVTWERVAVCALTDGPTNRSRNCTGVPIRQGKNTRK